VDSVIKILLNALILTGHWKGYGQNLGAGHRSWNQVVESWYNEVKDFPSSGVKKYR